MKLDESLLNSYKDQKLINFLSKNFDISVPERINKLKQLIHSNNIKMLKSELHALKNSFGNIGAIEIAMFCQQLEDLATADLDFVIQNISVLENKFIEAKIAFSNYVKNRESI